MFQRLSSLFFGEVQEVAAELKGPNPCVTEADEEGWMLVNLPGESPSVLQGGSGGVGMAFEKYHTNKMGNKLCTFIACLMA